jgi:predicted GNAT family N-acyltransferase
MMNFTIHPVTWHDAEPMLRAVREAVFIREQGVPVELEWDGWDETSHHVLALSSTGQAIGCGRILPIGHDAVEGKGNANHACPPLLNPLTQAGEEANESLREFKNSAHIGRIAVMPEWRGKKVGTAILEGLLVYASSRHYPEVDLDAQVQALPFYRNFEFIEEGEDFMDAGIPHRKIRMKL